MNESSTVCCVCAGAIYPASNVRDNWMVTGPDSRIPRDVRCAGKCDDEYRLIKRAEHIGRQGTSA